MSSAQEVISTVLGSCIAVCMYDERTKIGGMNHFMLPNSSLTEELHLSGTLLQEDELTKKSMRYGLTAMEVLIAEMLKSGAQRRNLSAKIFGGGKVLKSSTKIPNIGDQNIGFARAFLKTEGIPLLKENVGDSVGRKIFFLTKQNSIFVRRVEIESAVAEERKYMDKLAQMKNEESNITIF
ncbi:MAG: chemotaxis protein CheD [Spirochaetales bacterium]|nr:chemotaxis protein CheD [Spirochaetales bacterium]